MGNDLGFCRTLSMDLQRWGRNRTCLTAKKMANPELEYYWENMSITMDRNPYIIPIEPLMTNNCYRAARSIPVNPVAKSLCLCLPGHFDKVCDRVADAVLDTCLSQDSRCMIA